MKKYIFLALIGAFALTGMAKSPKRGVSENQFSMGSMLEALEPGVTWYYNWGNTPGKGYQNQVIDFEGIEYVPMCWNANYNADAIREYCKSHPQTKYLLGFNEPNFTAQANMTPQKAAEAWPAVQALAKELGLQLVAPALNYSPNPPYTDPLKWMDEFVALVGNDAFDFTAIHNYGGLQVMKTLAGNFHDRYGKDVWVTEFCYWPNEGSNNDYVSPDNQIASMVETVQWLETTPWIYRYAWFKAIGNNQTLQGPNYQLLAHEGSSSDPWFLSEQGKVYVGLGTFDAGQWHQPGSWVPAVDYEVANLVGLGASKDAALGFPLEINRFQAGASATWQFETKEATDYVITMRLGGFGEPTRFDPQLHWVLTDGTTETPLTEKFSPVLPNSDTDYVEYSVTVSLPAGQLQLKLNDLAPYSPSGIKISALRLDDLAGVDDVLTDSFETDGPVYNLQGVRVCNASGFAALPSGLYIIAGKKVIK